MTIYKLFAVATAALLGIGGLIAWAASAHDEHPPQRISIDPNPGGTGPP